MASRKLVLKKATWVSPSYHAKHVGLLTSCRKTRRLIEIENNAPHPLTSTPRRAGYIFHLLHAQNVLPIVGPRMKTFCL